MAKNLSSCGGQRRDELKLGDRAGGGDGGAAETGEVVAIGSRDAFDQTEQAQASEFSREGCGTELGQERDQIGAAHATNVELGALQRAQQ